MDNSQLHATRADVAEKSRTKGYDKFFLTHSSTGLEVCHEWQALCGPQVAAFLGPANGHASHERESGRSKPQNGAVGAAGSEPALRCREQLRAAPDADPTDLGAPLF